MDPQIIPLMGTLKPHTNGPLYSNTMIGTLAVDGWADIMIQRGGGWAPPSLLLVVPSVTAHPSSAVYHVHVAYAFAV